MCEKFERNKTVICVLVQETYTKLKTGFTYVTNQRVDSKTKNYFFFHQRIS